MAREGVTEGCEECKERNPTLYATIPTPPTAPSPQDYTNLPLWADPFINSATFSLKSYLSSIPNIERLLKSPQGRRALTRADPLLFALTYLPHHLKDANNPTAPPSFADCHFVWCRLALRWAANRNRAPNDPLPKPQEDRIAEVAPRMCGKSTWWFLIVPMWAAAHQHKRFVAAFASTATQAEKHLRTFKNEIDNNKYLREDYPDLCSPKRRPRGAVVSDRVDEYQAQDGFVFSARGVDSSNLGMKVEQMRPDLLLMDDVEPDETSYSPDMAKKRLRTIQDAILPLNIYASVVFVGTVTMPNSVIHQLVKSARKQKTEDWITDEAIKAHYYPPIVQENKGNKIEQRSLWPEKWSLEFLQSIKHTRAYAKNYANDPRGVDGDYWNGEDFTNAPFPKLTDKTQSFTRTAVFVDPPTTAQKTSDPAGIAIVTWLPPTKQDAVNYLRDQLPAEAGSSLIAELDTMSRDMSVPQGYNKHNKHATNKTVQRHPGNVFIRHAEQKRATGKALAKHVYALIANNPHLNIRRIVVEATQGGDLWLEVFDGSPVTVEITNPREGKETRFGRALEYYQKRPTLVTHDNAANLSELEEQQLGFPHMVHDDIADAAVSGTLYFLEPKPKKRKIKTRSSSYV